jgi:hypothetical protein
LFAKKGFLNIESKALRQRVNTNKNKKFIVKLDESIALNKRNAE